MKKVVVTGIGVASAVGLGVEAFWQRILAGHSAVAPLRSFDVTDFPTQIGAEIEMPMEKTQQIVCDVFQTQVTDGLADLPYRIHKPERRTLCKALPTRSPITKPSPWLRSFANARR